MKNYFWFVFSLVWAGSIVYLSFFKPVSLHAEAPWFENQDKVGHFVFYAVLSVLLIKSFSQEIIIQNPLSTSTQLAFAFGLLIELGQHFLTHDRDGSFMDVLANGLGIFLVAVLIKAKPKLFCFNPKT